MDKMPATRVLILAPTARDAAITTELLRKGGVARSVCGSIRELIVEINSGVGAILMTEEVINDPGIDRLLMTLNGQPSWSEIPVVMMMRGGSDSPAAERLLRSMRNVTLLERPAPTRSVLSAVQAAIRGRERQYQIRDQIEAIREGEQRFQAMANSIPQLAWMAKPDGWIFWYNQRWHAYCGSTPEQMEGWGWQSVHDPGELPRVMEKWKGAVVRGEPWEDTFPLRRHDGEYRWHLSRAMPFRDAQGGILLWFGTNTDITDQQQAADERQRLLESERAARQEAERVSRMKDQFLATLSHELRTPLNAIFGWTQLLKRGKDDPEMVAEGIDVIDRNVRVQTQLIEDLLDMSRIISGKVRLDVQRVELPEVIHAALEVVQPAAEAKGIRLEKVIDPNAGPVSGDPARLQQVLWNLLTNAIKFTSKGGKVCILLERVNSHVQISVSDTGEGINPDFLPHLFERFSQADGSSKRKHGGLGLGLSIVKSLVEMHGGTITARSEGPGKGALFAVHLPLRVTTQDEAPTLATSPGTRASLLANSPKLTGVKVLIVDDEPDARELVKRVLVEYEAVPALADSAAAASRMLPSFLPDVIVSDIGMPEQDGYEFIRSIRKEGVRTPAVALTAFARPQDRIRSIQAGYQVHLPKPVEPAELVAVIASLAGRLPETFPEKT